MQPSFSAENLSVGYNGKILIRDINIHMESGKILTLIGPNGAGKSTILKTITRQIPSIEGHIFIGDQDISALSGKALARSMAVVLTERIDPELMKPLTGTFIGWCTIGGVAVMIAIGFFIINKYLL